MNRYRMPEEYMRKLNEHPYVEAATEWTVTFTPEFKKIAYEEYCNGKSIGQIFEEAGFDVEKLGRKRLQNFRNSIVAQGKKETGFKDLRKDKSQQAPPSTEAQMEKRIRELERRNAYLEQENEFLKKIQSLEKGCIGKAGERK